MRGCDGNRHASERSGDKAWVHSERNALERLHHQRPRFACVTSFGRTNESDEADKPEKGKLRCWRPDRHNWLGLGINGLDFGSLASSPLLRILRFGLFLGYPPHPHFLALPRSQLFRRCDGSIDKL